MYYLSLTFVRPFLVDILNDFNSERWMVVAIFVYYDNLLVAKSSVFLFRYRSVFLTLKPNFIELILLDKNI